MLQKKILFQTNHENIIESFKEKLKTHYGFENIESEKVFSNSRGEMLFELEIK